MKSGEVRRIRRRLVAALTLARYRVRAWWHGVALPPGELDPLDRRMEQDQRYILNAAARLGPVFKTWWHGQYTTCLVGHARARRLLAAHEDRIVPRSIDLSNVCPHGWIRAMQGETHRRYRRLLLLALQETAVGRYEPEFRQVIGSQLLALASTAVGPDRTAIRATLRAISSTLMLRILFGVAPDTHEFRALSELYQQFGPQFPPRAINANNRGTFIALMRCVDGLRQELKHSPAGNATPSMLQHLVDQGADDQTVIGNLIFLFEPAHFDLYSLWHWLLWQIAGHPQIADRITREGKTNPADARDLIRATILETLRLEQSEILYREAQTDVAFEGLLLPKGEVVRIGLWEGHKDAQVFQRPFVFEPDRFLARDYDLDHFAAFGLDKRRCIGSELTMTLTTLFVEELVLHISCTRSGDAAPILGAYHWEPGDGVTLTVRQRPNL